MNKRDNNHDIERDQTDTNENNGDTYMYDESPNQKQKNYTPLL